MQVNHPKYNQRRVSCVKYLGELYNYRMLESAVVFKTLYSFITFGVVMDGERQTLVLPQTLCWASFFKVSSLQIIGLILDSWGHVRFVPINFAHWKCLFVCYSLFNLTFHMIGIPLTFWSLLVRVQCQLKFDWLDIKGQIK